MINQTRLKKSLFFLIFLSILWANPVNNKNQPSLKKGTLAILAAKNKYLNHFLQFIENTKETRQKSDDDKNVQRTPPLRLFFRKSKKSLLSVRNASKKITFFSHFFLIFLFSVLGKNMRFLGPPQNPNSKKRPPKIGDFIFWGFLQET